MPPTRSIQNIAVIAAAAFTFNIAWEYLQCTPFLIHKNLAPTHFDMLVAGSGDVLITLITYFIISWLSSDGDWFVKPWNRRHWFALISLAVLFSCSIELQGLHTNRWSYTEITPLVFGRISMIPVAQLLFLLPLTFYSSKKIIALIDAKSGS